MSNELAKFGINDLTAMADAMTNVAAENSGTGFGGKDLLKMTQNGEWLYGQDGTPAPDTIVVNPGSFMRGWVSWHMSAIQGEAMVKVGDAVPDKSTLPASPAAYVEQMSFEAADPQNPDLQLIYKTSSQGGVRAIKALIGKLGMQLRNDPANIVAEVQLDIETYTSKKFGKKITNPVLTVVEWLPHDALEQAPEQVEQASEPEPEQAYEPKPEPEQAYEPKPAPTRRRRRRPAAA